MNLRGGAAALSVALLAACGSASSDTRDDAALQVTAANYPLAHLTEKVGGEHVSVSTLTPPGAEPHDLELTAKAIVGLDDADLVVYQSGFQPAVDEAVALLDATNVFDVVPSAHLEPTASGHADGHAEERHGTLDPHFWLDPERYADVGEALAERLADADPAHAEDYLTNADDFRAAMTDLDHDYRTALADCRSTELVVSHGAFGYLARSYGFTQESVLGPGAHGEPVPTQVAEITEFVREQDVSTIYTEVLLPTDVAETIAEETGVDVAVLDPIEGLTEESRGEDYLALMRSNLRTLIDGQDCS